MELSEDTAMIPSPDPYHCPSHLETLTRMDQLFVYKERTTEDRLAEVCCGIKPTNRYFVKDGMGNKVFSILEDSESCDKQCYGVGCPFTMNVTDHSNQEVIRLVHPFVCTSCSSHELEVQSPPGIAIGYARQNWHVCLPKFTLENERGEPAFKIEGPCVGFTCCTEENFEMVSLNEAAIDRSFGKIIKPFSCSGPNADFVLRFPSNLDVKMKATVLGACILIVDQLLIYKEETTEECLSEACCGIKPISRYFVIDGIGNKVFSILEDSECCERYFCASGRSFIMNITDNSNQEVIRLVHASVCCYGSHELEVQSPPGTAIGYIRQNWHCCLSKFTVENERGEPEFKIERPFVGCIRCMDQNFELLSLNEAAIDRSLGKIFKPSSCCGSNADFVLRFPSNLDVKMKDCMFYDTSQRKPIWCII